jgi:hypothetical protein
MNKTELPISNICPKCDNPAMGTHLCPYKKEIYDDYDTLCTCCEECEDNCRLDV